MLVRKYGNETILGGIYGSTARDTDTAYSDLEMFFIVSNESKAKSLRFAYEGMPVGILVQNVADVEKDIKELTHTWPLHMGRLFNIRITSGNESVLEDFRRTLERIPEERFSDFITNHTPLCYEGLDKLKTVKTIGNIHETGLFVAEVLMDFMLLTAIFNREYINHDYLGGLFESFKFKHLPKDYEKTARKLMKWTNLTLDETIQLAGKFVRNFVSFMAENGIKVKEHTSLEELEI